MSGPRQSIRWHGLRIRSFWIGRGWAATYWDGPGSHFQVNGFPTREEAVRELREWVAESKAGKTGAAS